MNEAMTCTVVSFPTRKEAIAAKQAFYRERRVSASSYYCESCDCFHLRANMKRLHMSGRALEVLRLIGMGHTYAELAGIMGISHGTVKWYVEEINFTFGALNTANAICIAIALGVLNPLTFVPPIRERCDHASTNPG